MSNQLESDLNELLKLSVFKVGSDLSLALVAISLHFFYHERKKETTTTTTTTLKILISILCAYLDRVRRVPLLTNY